MSFVAGKVLARFGTRAGISQFAVEKIHPSLCSTISIQARCKTKLPRPSIFLSSKKQQERADEKDKHRLTGYFLLAIPVSTFILGTWQVRRLKWKLNLIEDLQKRITQPPIELPENLEELESKDYCHIKVTGRFLHEKEFPIGPRSLIIDGKGASESTRSFAGKNTTTGYCIITPFQVEDRDLTILVNRGWVPRELKNPATRKEEQLEGLVEITGILRLHEERPPFMPKNVPDRNVWHYRDLHAMAEKYDTAPIYIDMVRQKDFLSFPVGGQTKVTMRNDHISYIFTWYSLSAITGYMWYKLMIKKLPLL